jgi:hypothetical protein
VKVIATDQKVQIKWFVWSMGEKMPRTASMRGEWGYDAVCSCGWETKTGGATYRCVLDEVISHKFADHNYSFKGASN